MEENDHLVQFLYKGDLALQGNCMCIAEIIQLGMRFEWAWPESPEDKNGGDGRKPDFYVGLDGVVKSLEEYAGNHYHVLKLGEHQKPGKSKPSYFRIPNLDLDMSAQGGTFAPGDLLPIKK